jgi:hypothetical protein
MIQFFKNVKKEKKSQRTTMTINIVQNEFNTDFNPIDLYINIIFLFGTNLSFVVKLMLLLMETYMRTSFVVGPDCFVIVTKC